MSRAGLTVRRRPAGGSLPILLTALACVAVFGMACGRSDEPAAVPTPTAAPVAAPTPTTAPAATPAPTAAPAAAPESGPATEGEALTMAYVQRALERYERYGLDATVAYYSSEASIEGERYLFIIDGDDGALRAMPFYRQLLGGRHVDADELLAFATQEGRWLDRMGLHPVFTDGGLMVRQRPLRSYLVLRDGLLFVSSHSVLLENLADATVDYLNRAIALYESEGLDATVAHYGSRDSLEGQLYLFLVGADDIYLAHPIFPHLVGTDIKDVVASVGHQLGREIAQATEEGIWVEYLWPNPVTGIEEPKSTWAVRHDGLIFASGYYLSGETADAPSWYDADPREHTVGYVERAIARYERDGLDSMVAYYNSVASFEGEWYLFAMDEDDIYIVHPLLPRLVGTDVKDVVASDGHDLGREIAGATEDGLWVEYLWPHPVTLADVPKVGYAVRHDGIIFASGYYPVVADPGDRTKDYVRRAMDHYDREGAEAAVAYYNSRRSVEGSHSLLMVDPEGVIVAAAAAPELVGLEATEFTGIVAGEPIGEELLGATEDGHWFTYLWPNQRTAGVLTIHLWIARHEGYVFASAYYAHFRDPVDGNRDGQD